MKIKVLGGVLCVCVALCVSSVVALAAPERGKIATISIQQILGKSKAALDAQKILQAEVDKFQSKFKADEDALTAMKNEIEKKGSAWSDEVRAEKEREYQKRLRDYGMKTEDAKQEMQQLEKRYMEPILKQLHDVIADIGKKNGYSLILENTMKGLRNRTGLLYADDTLDISDQVQKELDSRLKK
ncbi:OmpH family outer membrane protein [Thiovibrio frasassiensis]|uniref:OmpH family outer membrane protein n=1 Tax=Thiovibrio frasassiensis TaxID=2984131 RepID=A0A9X4MI09_9BACT|nr:OmpH family outer membrane protein [Thiovibrio frasassiensis]MDG4476595.1 OmpH family outer membrane protein [Thiovibrio frasassiensis]